MLSATRIDVNLNTSIDNKEIRIVLCNIHIAECYTFNDIPNLRPNNNCHLATDSVTILKQICHELWDNSTSKSER